MTQGEEVPMGARSPAVDAYIAKSPDYARPILERIREAFHAGCPEVEERIKWGVPSFEYKGMLGGAAAFKNHVTFGFWKSRLMEDFDRLFERGPRASAMGARVTSLADLPAKKVLVAYVKEAKRLNDEGIKEPKLARPKRTIRVTVPADLRAALGRNAKARAVFEGFAPSHKREYVEWIVEAKRDETRATRLRRTIEWLAQGKHRNWKYEPKP
jgi:uncharacterized protein YdeI (YjbR/CyaY-like superfamily)